MSDDSPSIISHVSIGTNQFEKAAAFYDKVLGAIGCRRIMEHPGSIAYGKQYPEFWLQTPLNGEPATVGNGFHIGFMVPSKERVDAFYQAAVDAGASGEGEPGPRPHYGEPYYGCFVRDPDGHKIEATYWDMELAAKIYGS
ncbi:glyoxalase [Hahella sp. CCB-MM4]|uniref:VOC family protein n=1 Tax=Hahella sp. (strain CCB-MM4) TaxID=1926491 RepID=UPI000B9B5D6A|nr:VOC family protein [Hahella sp. CCB-MM4]OZG74982.1 glyoxalase [Hahella sp. CCB-MM4]